MREIASRQAADISGLRSVAESHLKAATAKGQEEIVELAKSARQEGNAREEERWKQMLSEASQHQQEARGPYGVGGYPVVAS